MGDEVLVEARIVLEAIVRDIKFGAFKYPMVVKVEGWADGLFMLIQMSVDDREDQLPITLETPRVRVSLEDLEKPLLIVERVMQLAKDVVVHEFQEQFMYKGKRIFDPHLRLEFR